MGQTELEPVNSSLLSSTETSSVPTSLSKPTSSKSICTPVTEHAVYAAINQKGLDVKALDVSGLCSFADNFLIVSGTSERHVKGIADGIAKRLGKDGCNPLSISGYDCGEWILMDYDDLIIHVFYEPSRQLYELDELWQSAPLVPLGEKLKEEMRFLRTGSFR